MGVRARIALILVAVSVAIAGGIVIWKPWGGALPAGCAGSTSGLTGVQPGTVVGFWMPIDARQGIPPQAITLRSADLTLEGGPGRFVGVRVRTDRLGEETSVAIARWPDREYNVSNQTTRPLADYRLPRGVVTSVYFLVEQTAPGKVRWSSPGITYQQGWRTYTATSPDCFFETDSKPMS